MRFTKLLFAKLILLAITPAVAQVNASAYGYFYGPDGSLALVSIVRTQDVNKIVTTELFYTFCGQANLGTSCQKGDGIIPNSTVTGGINTNKITAPSVFSVQVDTSAVAGYRNQLCTQGIDYDGDCLGEVDSTGGLISISWTRTNLWANVSLSTNKSYQFGKLVFSGSSALYGFSAKQSGTVLGVLADSDAVMSTSSDSQTLQTQFAARKVHK